MSDQESTDDSIVFFFNAENKTGKLEANIKNISQGTFLEKLIDIIYYFSVT